MRCQTVERWEIDGEDRWGDGKLWVGNVRGKNVEDAGNDTKGIEPVIAPAMAFM